MKDTERVATLLRIQAVNSYLIGFLFLILAFSFVRDRWEGYDAPTGLYTMDKTTIIAPDTIRFVHYAKYQGTWSYPYGELFYDSLTYMNDSTKLGWGAPRRIWDIGERIDIINYTPVTKRKIRRMP